jgi:excisionase family DNA binding protein
MTTIEHLRSRPGYLGVVEAAECIGINRDTLCDWIKAGKFKAYRIGNANKIDRLYLADWLEARELATV